MDVTTAVTQRISTRAFLPDGLSEKDIRDWLETGQRAPSGGNVQPWRTIVVAGSAKTDVTALAHKTLSTNPAGEETDRAIYPKGLWDPFEARRRKVGYMLYDALGIAKEDRAARALWFANNFKFFDAPVAVFIVIDERMGHGQWAHAGMYLQTLALLAEERGWGTCMQECWGMLRPSLKAHFNLAPTEMVWCGMAVGKPDASHRVNALRAERASQGDIVELIGFDTVKA